MNKFKLIDISIKNFRGFKKEVVFNLEGNYNSVIISGNNGIGKTSFYDAIEWAFTGKLFRYSDESEEKKCKFINFQPAEEGELARVALTLASQNTSFTVIRQLTKFDNVISDFGEKNTILTIINDDGSCIYGDEAYKFMSKKLISEEWKDKIEFNDVFSQYHLLTQDKMKYFIQGIKMPERYNQIANLLGNDRYLKYNKEVAKLRKGIQKENLELEKKISEAENVIKGLESVGSNFREINIEEFNDMNEIILKLIEKLNEYKVICNFDYNFNIDTYNVDEINKIMHNVVLMKDTLSQIKESKKIKEQELNILKRGFNNYLIDVKNQDRYRKSVAIYNKMDKIAFLRGNIRSYVSYKNEVDKINKKIQNIKQQINEGKLKLDFVRHIYLDLKQKISYIKDINIQKNIDTRILSELQSFLAESKVIWKNDKFAIYFKSDVPEVFNKDFIVQGEFDNSYLSYDQIYRSISLKNKDSIDNSIDILRRISKENSNYKNDLVEMEKELSTLSDVESGIKEILMLARNHIDKIENGKLEKTSCPVCSTPFIHLNLMNIIDEKLSMSNMCVKNKQLDIERIKKVLKDNNDLSKKNEMVIYNFLEEYVNEVMRIYKSFEDIGILLKKNNEDLFMEKEQLNLKLEDTYKNNSKYINLLDEMKVQNENLEENLETIFNEFNFQLSQLGYSYEKCELDEIGKLIYNTNIQIELYNQKLRSNSIDINNFESSINKKIDFETRIIESMTSVQSDLELIKSKLYEIHDIMKNNNRYSIWKQKGQELIKYKNNYLIFNTVIENLNKLEAAISNTILNLNQEIMAENEEFINSIFRRIFTHPYYRKLKFEFGENNHGNKTLKIVCYHENGETLVNPAYIFSSTQINILALSVFLSMAIKQKCTNLDLILLDDPIQNMDDMNILSFIDVLRSCIDQSILDKQLVISTHDNKINNLFIKKFRFYKSKIYKFADYTFEGPKIISKELN